MGDLPVGRLLARHLTGLKVVGLERRAECLGLGVDPVVVECGGRQERVGVEQADDLGQRERFVLQVRHESWTPTIES